VPLGDGLLLVGGSDADGPTASSYIAPFNASSGDLAAWVPQVYLLPVASTDGFAAQIGGNIWLYGGTTADGPSPLVQIGVLATSEAGVPTIAGWAVQAAETPMHLPAGRTNASAWAANGTLYLAGGSDAAGATNSELWWAIPTADGEITEWKHAAEMDLPAAGLAGSATLVSGVQVFLIGGLTGGAVTDATVDANLAPQAPFFQLGLVGATVPALKVDGEIGQQLGYLNASGAGGAGFVALIVIGVAMANRERTMALLERMRRRR
jgi:hypothetical protein